MPEGHTLHRLARDLGPDPLRAGADPDIARNRIHRSPREDDHGGEEYVRRRNGQACWVCGSKVRTELLVGRNLFWCGRCQRRG